MIVGVKDILLNSDIFPKICAAVVFVIMIAAIIYGYKKHTISEVIKSPSSFIFLLLAVVESFYFIYLKYLQDSFTINIRMIFIVESVIFTAALIISLIDEKYYLNILPITICRIAVFIIGLSIILIILEFIFIVFILIGSVLLILIAVWSAVDFRTFKKNILFWRNRT